MITTYNGKEVFVIFVSYSEKFALVTRDKDKKTKSFKVDLDELVGLEDQKQEKNE